MQVKRPLKEKMRKDRTPCGELARMIVKMRPAEPESLIGKIVLEVMRPYPICHMSCRGISKPRSMILKDNDNKIVKPSLVVWLVEEWNRSTANRYLVTWEKTLGIYRVKNSQHVTQGPSLLTRSC